jgi:hypothetical protein
MPLSAVRQILIEPRPSYYISAALRQVKYSTKDLHINEFPGEEYLKEGRLAVH